MIVDSIAETVLGGYHIEVFRAIVVICAGAKVRSAEKLSPIPLRNLFVEGRSHDRAPTGTPRSVPVVIGITRQAVVRQVYCMTDFMGDCLAQGTIAAIVNQRSRIGCVVEAVNVGVSTTAAIGERIPRRDDSDSPFGVRIAGFHQRFYSGINRGDIHVKSGKIFGGSLPAILHARQFSRTKETIIPVHVVRWVHDGLNPIPIVPLSVFCDMAVIVDVDRELRIRLTLQVEDFVHPGSQKIPIRIIRRIEWVEATIFKRSETHFFTPRAIDCKIVVTCPQTGSAQSQAIFQHFCFQNPSIQRLRCSFL